MSAVRKSHVPLPGSKSKSKPQVLSSQPTLSQEFVDSDDDSSNDNTAQPKATEKAKTTIAVHRPKTDGMPKSTPQSSTKAKTTATKSASKVSAAPKKAAPREAPKRQQTSDSSSSEDSDDESEEIEAPAQKSIKNSNTTTESSSESSSDEEETPQTARSSIQDRSQTAQGNSHSVEIRQIQPFVPPKGFLSVPVNQKTTSDAARIFENLQGKQVWHITAPANVSLKDLKEMTMEKVLDGEAVLKHKGTEYGFSTIDKSEEGTREVMIPYQNGYKAVPSKISHTMHLQEVVRLPKVNSKQANQSANSEDTASITRSTIRAPRPQVKGLKMRFFLSGFGDKEPGTLGDSDSEEERPAQPAGLVIPNGVNLPAKSEKRKRHSTNGDGSLESPTKKHKKQLTPEELKRKEEKKAKKEKKRAMEAAKGRS